MNCDSCSYCTQNNFAYCVKPTVKNVRAFYKLFIDLKKQINFQWEVWDQRIEKSIVSEVLMLETKTEEM